MIAVQAAPAGLRPEMVVSFVLLDLLLILVAARMLGALARRLRQPTVVGEIVAGVLLGPTLLGATLAAWPRPWSFLQCETALAAASTPIEPSVTACLFPPQAQSALAIIGQLALALFMLLVGLDLDVERLRGRARAVTTVVIGVVGVPLLAGLLLGWALYGESLVPSFGTADQPSLLGFQLAIGSLLAVTAFPVMAHILREKRCADSPMGTLALAAAAVVTVLMFLTIAAAAAVAGGDISGLGTRGTLVAAYLLAMWFGARPMLTLFERRFESAGGLSATGFGLVFALLLASSLVAHLLGVSVIVGGFLAGLVLPARPLLRAELTPRIQDVTLVVLLPVFLAYSGLRTDFTLLDASAAGAIGLLLVAAIVGKWAAGAVAARLSGLSWPEGNLVGILMNCRGLLVLVAALVALEQGLITPELQVGAVVVALVTTVMTGPLFDRFSRAVPRMAEPQGPLEPTGVVGSDT